MTKSKLTQSTIEFINSNWSNMTGVEMCNILNISESCLYSYRKQAGITTPAELIISARRNILINKVTSTPEMDAYIKDHYLIEGIKTMANRLKKSEPFIKRRMKQLSLVVPQEVKLAMIMKSRIPKGNIPPNKGKKMDAELKERIKHTFFKKGDLPRNTLHDNAITVRIDHKNRKGKSVIGFAFVAFVRWL